ncbi:MAG TPA: hypothetical protein VG755_24915 [Nannocystaceae bacterium]|nr:hypothetical protein [Nannocystaceae bacterium]
MLLAALLGACGPTPTAEPASAPIDDAVAPAANEDAEADAVRARLQAYEDRRRGEIDLASLQPWSASAGDDPFALARLPDGGAVGVLRGAEAVVLLGPSGEERARLPAPGRPTGVAVGPAGDIVVVGETSSRLVHVRADGERLIAVGEHVVPSTTALRDVVLGDDTVWLLDRDREEVIALPWKAKKGVVGPRIALASCRGGAALERAGDLLVAVCVLDRSLWLGELAKDGRSVVRATTIVHDGPWWSAAAVDDGDGWLVAGGGVEDRRLDRSDGSFGWVDSYAFVQRVTRCGEQLCSESRAAVDVGEHGVVTPKWLSLAPAQDGFALVVTGYGSPTLVELQLDREGKLLHATPRAALPGLRDAIRSTSGWLAADPLLDRWVVLDDDGVRAVGLASTVARDPMVRVGEALFFTSLLAPHAKSDGRSSRFTCETCHFEGGGDGRVHYTGRGDVHAATKPLVGLFPNRPHFSRALDRTMAVMVDNEFAVANRGSEVGPRFSVDPNETPWVRELGVAQTLGPDELRRAFIEFLIAFDHEPNPRAQGRRAFDAQQRRGAELFATHCERCHQARLQTDDASTRVPPSRWEALVLSPRAPIVWATEQRMKTGIVPLVHEEGARVTSLRRLALKRPYFTNGSAADLDAVLGAVVLAPAFAHGPNADRTGGPDTASRLDDEQRAALRAFLELL